MVPKDHLQQDGYEEKGKQEECGCARLEEASKRSAPHSSGYVLDKEQSQAACAYAYPVKVRREVGTERLVEVQEETDHGKQRGHGSHYEGKKAQPANAPVREILGVDQGLRPSLSTLPRSDAGTSSMLAFWLSCSARM